MLRRIHYNNVGGEACFRQVCDTLYWPNMQGKSKTMCTSAQCVMSMLTSNRRRPWCYTHSLHIPGNWWVWTCSATHGRISCSWWITRLLGDRSTSRLPDLSAETAIKRCKAQFAQYSIPDQVICGGQFDWESFGFLWGSGASSMSCSPQDTQKLTASLFYTGGTRPLRASAAAQHNNWYYYFVVIVLQWFWLIDLLSLLVSDIHNSKQNEKF